MSTGLGASGRGLLEGRVAVVTGGARGIGAAIAAAFAAEGASGAVLDLAGPPPPGPPSGWSFVPLDVRDEASVHDAFSAVAGALGHPHVVVANAGVVPRWTAIERLDIGEWDEVFAVNARGVALTVREAARQMARPGSIVVMSSCNGWKGDPHLPAYVASKHAVVGLVRSAALDLGAAGIRVNAIGPGPIATDALRGRMAGRAERTGVDVEAALAEAAGSTALGRIATAAEVANAALFLASDLSSAITGHLLPVDGGLL